MIKTLTTTIKDNWIELLGMKREVVPVLIIGNNPIEMTAVIDLLNSNDETNFQADVSFDVKDSLNFVSKEKPSVVLIDDNIPSSDINRLVKVLRQNAKTSDIKLIVLKSSNWNYNVIDHVDDYILKDTLNTEMLGKIIVKNLHQPEEVEA